MGLGKDASSISLANWRCRLLASRNRDNFGFSSDAAADAGGYVDVMPNREKSAS